MTTKALLKSFVGLSLVGLFGLVGVFFAPSKAHAACSFDTDDGYPTSSVPNNGDYYCPNPTTAGSPDPKREGLYTPWLVVALKGMTSPTQLVLLQIPVDNPTTTVTVKSACDDDPIYDNNDNPYTVFFFPQASYLSVVPQGSNISQSPSGSGNYRCSSSGGVRDISFQVTVTNTTATSIKEITDSSGVKKKYYQVAFKANIPTAVRDTVPDGSVYENQFRVMVGGGSFVSYASILKSDEGDYVPGAKPSDIALSQMTGIYNLHSRTQTTDDNFYDRDKALTANYWSTTIKFAMPCGASPDSRKILFYDADAATPSYPDNLQSNRKMKYSLVASYRNGLAAESIDPNAGTKSGDLSGGDDVIDGSFGSYTFDKDHIYTLYVYDIYVLNSIQVVLPFDQINSLDHCGPTITPTLSCSTAGATIEPGGYTPQIRVSYTAGATDPNATVNSTATINGVTRTVSGTSLTPNTTDFPIDLPPPISLSAGTYPITASVSGTAGSITFPSTPCDGAANISVVALPYFKVFKGGVRVGSGFNSGTTTCTTPNPSSAGRVQAYASNASYMHGASGQYELTALGQVYDSFYSSGGLATATPQFKALTLANNSASGTYGGSFGGQSCITDYYSTTQKTGIPTFSGNTDVVTLNNMSGDQVVSTGDLNLAGGSLLNGSKLAVYVTGNVFITSNINVNPTNAAYNSLSDIPFFALVVKGNIMIAPGVSRLDGIYIAQPNGGSGGGIYTCAASINTLPPTATLYGTCGTPLTFNGAVVAKTLKLLRTNGTLRSAANNEGVGSSNVAETFNGLPELYLANPAFRIDSTTSKLYDSVTSLPPLL